MTTLAAARWRLSELEFEISRLQTQLDLPGPVFERASVQDHLAEYKYPIHSIPNEILSEIFLQYIPLYPACPPLLGDGSPTKLTHICRHWRQIAHSTPSLWRAIEVFAQAVYPPVPQIEAVETWLKRSGSLSLSILVGSRWADALAPHMSQLLELISLHHTRWQHCALLFPLPRWTHGQSWSRISGLFPRLERLDIQARTTSPLGSLVGPLNAPQLRTAYLDAFQFRPQELEESLVAQLLPWNRLTRLSLKYATPGAVDAILHLTTNLVFCSLRVRAKSEDRSREHVPAIHLPALRFFVVGEPDDDPTPDIYPVLKAVRAPALEKLYFNAMLLWQGTGDRTATRVVDVVQAFGCRGSLQHICIVDTSLNAENYRSMLPRIPTIEAFQRDDVSGPPRNTGPYEAAWGELSWDLFNLLGSNPGQEMRY
uniref:F-box domain-containing protein n=1 Tax=Mycena chlorophos TaxID=658473 RepID=A0ABQ0L4G2_MYCCL|nr:predicted protein [Mycena chlorophos]